MTIEERCKAYEERLQERRNMLVQVQRECHQLEGAILTLREMMNESATIRRPEGGDHPTDGEPDRLGQPGGPVGDGRLYGADTGPEG